MANPVRPSLITRKSWLVEPGLVNPGLINQTLGSHVEGLILSKKELVFACCTPLRAYRWRFFPKKTSGSLSHLISGKTLLQ